MSDRHNRDRERARQARTLSIVIASTMLLLMLSQWIGGQLNLPTRYVFLFDFAALAGFFWAMVVAWQLWRGRSED